MGNQIMQLHDIQVKSTKGVAEVIGREVNRAGSCSAEGLF